MMRATQIAAAAAAVLLAWPAGAQNTPKATPGSPEQAAQYATDKLSSEVGLTAEQMVKVKKIHLDQAHAVDKLLQKLEHDTSAAGDRALARGVLKAVRQTQGQLKTVLTPGQWALHQQHRAERLAMTQTELMAAGLDLSRAQILDVGRINLENAGPIIRALDKPPGTPTQQLLAAAQPAMQTRDSALKRVLTVDQWRWLAENRRALRDLFVEQATTTVASAAVPKR
jgi:hypothetical protein